MANRKEGFEVGKWYHCYNRGIENRTVFEDLQDYRRFLETLYLANDEQPLRRNDLHIDKFEDIFALERGDSLVTLGAFCLMDNHFHLALAESTPGGITSFMRKLGTAYTLYFNGRHKRSGNLFLKPFQSLEVDRSSFVNLISYVHSVPATLYEPEWKANHVVDSQFLEERLLAYPYSSLRLYMGAPVATSAIVDQALLSATRPTPLAKRLQEARKYLAESKHFPK